MRTHARTHARTHTHTHTHTPHPMEYFCPCTTAYTGQQHNRQHQHFDCMCIVCAAVAHCKAMKKQCREQERAVKGTPSTTTGAQRRHRVSFISPCGATLIIIKVFIKCKSLSVETILSAAPPPPTHTHTHTRARTYARTHVN